MFEGLEQCSQCKKWVMEEELELGKCPECSAVLENNPLHEKEEIVNLMDFDNTEHEGITIL